MRIKHFFVDCEGKESWILAREFLGQVKRFLKKWNIFKCVSVLRGRSL